MTDPFSGYKVFTVVLSCRSRYEPHAHHTMDYAVGRVNYGDEIFCSKCDKIATVIAADYFRRAECETCGWHGRVFNSGSVARNSASSHRRSHRGHSVDVREIHQVSSVILLHDAGASA